MYVIEIEVDGRRGWLVEAGAGHCFAGRLHEATKYPSPAHARLAALFVGSSFGPTVVEIEPRRAAGRRARGARHPER